MLAGKINGSPATEKGAATGEGYIRTKRNKIIYTK